MYVCVCVQIEIDVDIYVCCGGHPPPRYSRCCVCLVNVVLPKVDETTFGDLHSQDTHNSGNTEGGGNDPRNNVFQPRPLWSRKANSSVCCCGEVEAHSLQASACAQALPLRRLGPL